MCVSLNNVQGETLPVTSSVPQGSVSGPLLFLLFINHLGSYPTCSYKVFADDLKIYLKHPRTSFQHISDQLQRDKDTLSEVSSSWGLKFAPSKCVHLRFRRGVVQEAGGDSYQLGGEVPSTVSSHRDLGVHEDTKLMFHPHILKTVAMAGGVAANILKSTVCGTVPFMTFLLVTDVRQLMDFASPVWNTGFLGDVRLLESI